MSQPQHLGVDSIRAAALLASCAIALVAGGAVGCRKYYGPRLEEPTIGVRGYRGGPIQKGDTVTNATYLACDVRYLNIPSGSKVRISWNYYRDGNAGRPEEKSGSDKQELSGNGTLHANLDTDTRYFAPGVYECKFRVFSEVDVYNDAISARVTVKWNADE